MLQASKETVDLTAWKLPTKRELVETAREWAGENLHGDAERERLAFQSVYESITLGKREGTRKRWTRPATIVGGWLPEPGIMQVPPRGLEPRFPA